MKHFGFTVAHGYEIWKGYLSAESEDEAEELIKAEEVEEKERPYWMPNSKFFLLSITPEFSDDYEADQCWHGCDRVSRLIRQIKGEDGAWELYGGGGS